jgi:hypothetical protein
MTRNPTLRAQLAAQLESLETVCRLARTREQLGQHAEQEELAETWYAVQSFATRIRGLVGEIGEVER